MPEEREKLLLEQPWPPEVKVSEDESVAMTELDVSWIYCQVLNMSWKDANAVKDNLERRFLYDKCMALAEGMQKQADLLDEKRKEYEAAIDKKIEQLGRENVPIMPLDPELEKPMNADLKL